MSTSIPLPILKRLTSYLFYLKHLPCDAPLHISATAIAKALRLNHVQVRKDLSSVSDKGKPKVGYLVGELIADIEHILDYDNVWNSVLVGSGNLGKALLSYKNLKGYGLDIIAAFDNDPAVIGREIAGYTIQPADKAEELCRQLDVRIGIITVPAHMAQSVCDNLIAGGVQGIWNFAPINLNAPEHIVIQNEEMASSLAILTNKLAETIVANSANDRKE